MKKIIIISGFSGVGKSSILKMLFGMNNPKAKDPYQFWLSKSDTTRQPRNSFDYYNFINTDLFEQHVRENYYLEQCIYAQCSYGTPRGAVFEALNQDKIVLLDVNYQGMKQVLQECKSIGDIEIKTVFICADAYTLLARLQQRGDSLGEIKKRLTIAAEEAEQISDYDYVLVNDTLLTNTAQTLLSIVNGDAVKTESFCLEKFNLEIKTILSALEQG